MIGLILSIILWVLLGLLLLVLVLLALPVFAEITYTEKATVVVRYLFFRFPVVSAEEDKEKEKPKAPKKKPRKEKKKKEKPTDAKSPQKNEKNVLKAYIRTVKERNGITGLLSLFCDLLKLLASTFAGILRHIHFRKFDLFLLYAGGDAAKTADTYGKICGVVYPTLEELFHLSPCKNHRISLDVSFMEEKPVTELEVTLWFSPLRLVADVLLLGIKSLLRILKARKMPKEKPAEKRGQQWIKKPMTERKR